MKSKYKIGKERKVSKKRENEEPLSFSIARGNAVSPVELNASPVSLFYSHMQKQNISDEAREVTIVYGASLDKAPLLEPVKPSQVLGQEQSELNFENEPNSNKTLDAMLFRIFEKKEKMDKPYQNPYVLGHHSVKDGKNTFESRPVEKTKLKPY